MARMAIAKRRQYSTIGRTVCRRWVRFQSKDGIGAILAVYSQVYGLRNCEKEQMKNSAIQCNEDSLKPADVGQTRIDYANLRYFIFYKSGALGRFLPENIF
jgi:hypothetical protein